MRISRFEKTEFAGPIPGGPSNICGVLVHAKPEVLAATREALAQVPGVEVHAAQESGKIVVTVEDTPEAFASDTISSFNDIPGVLNVSLVYHHFEQLDA